MNFGFRSLTREVLRPSLLIDDKDRRSVKYNSPGRSLLFYVDRWVVCFLCALVQIPLISTKVRNLDFRFRSMVLQMASKQVLASATDDGPGAYNPEHVKNFLKVVEDMRVPGDFDASDLKQMKRVVREIFVREEALLTKARVLQALASGAGEEVKLVSNVLRHVKLGKQRVEEKQRQQENIIGALTKERDELFSTASALREEVRSLSRERDGLFASLRNEREEFLSSVCTLREEGSLLMKERDELLSSRTALREEVRSLKRLGEERARLHETQSEELELGYKERLAALQIQLDESVTKFRAFEEGSVSRLKELEQKDAHYGKCLHHLLKATRDLRTTSDSSKSMVLGLQRKWDDEIGGLGAHVDELGKQAEGCKKLFAENRKLYNEVLDLKGNIRVFCRVRPSAYDGSQLDRNNSTVDYIGGNGDIMVVNPNKQGRDTRRIFNFHKVFGSNASQEDVYLDTQPLIRSVLDGYNVCIFAYGQTGSGKTYTMSGPNNSVLESDYGVNYRALNDLFVITERRRETFQYEIGVQMIEIYNEQVRDLLSAPGSSIKKLEIRNHHSQLNVPDACLMSVTSKDDVLELMKIGGRNRSVGATALNERSSRSHSVLTVHVQAVDLNTGAVLRGCLHLVDLAGSERIDKSEVTGDRLKEALHINKSLSALGDVIAALAQKSAHVPYRNSKLTLLLQDSLGGQGKALMVVHITPDHESFGETISTLKFAERVATVELGAARSNKEAGEIRELKEHIANMKDTMAQKDSEIERLRSCALEDSLIMRTPSKLKRPINPAVGPLGTRRLSKDNLLAPRRAKPSPEGGGFGSTNVRFI